MVPYDIFDNKIPFHLKAAYSGLEGLLKDRSQLLVQALIRVTKATVSI